MGNWLEIFSTDVMSLISLGTTTFSYVFQSVQVFNEVEIHFGQQNFIKEVPLHD